MTNEEWVAHRKRHDDAMRRIAAVQVALRGVASDYETMSDVVVAEMKAMLGEDSE